VDGLILLAIASLPGLAPAGTPPPGTTERVAPVVVESADPSGGLTLGDARIVDDPGPGSPSGAAGPSPSTRRIAGFLFKVERTPARSAEAEIDVESGDARRHLFRSAIEDLRDGSELRIDVDLPVAIRDEGRMRATLVVRSRWGRTLFRGVYVFGFPRYTTTGALARVSTGTVIRDGFDSDRIDERLWEVKDHGAGEAAVEQKGGRLRITLSGPTGYNGLVGRTQIDSRDLVLVCRMGIDSPPGSLHRGLLHLCGSGPWSPDNWIEIAVGGSSAGTDAYLNFHVPEEIDTSDWLPVTLPTPAGEGGLFEISCDSASHLCRAYVRSGGDWRPIGKAFEVPARGSHVELKSEGWLDPGLRSVVWFDDLRLYPSPESRYITVVLRRKDGGGPGLGAGGRWPPVAFDPANREMSERGIVVRLYARDGTTLVSGAIASLGDGFALIRLDATPWDVYPVPAVIRVFTGEKQIGPDHVIESAGVDGLYPDDVYTLEID
jgi:hypothetical protein